MLADKIKELPPTPDILALRERIDLILAEYESFEYDFGLKITSLEHPQTFYEYQIDKPFIPASNLKIITTGAAFSILGSDFRWTTDFYINDFGNLYIRASGDPTWNNSFKKNMINSVTKSISDSLKFYGFHRINNIAVDPGTFHNSQIGLGWKDENRLFTYSAKPSVIAFNDNAVQIMINPASVGMPARISLYPVNSGFKIVNHVTTVSNRNRQGFDFATDHDNNTLTIRGNIWVNSRTQYRSIAIPRPELYALNVLKTKLIEYGIRIDGDVYFDSISGRDIILNFYKNYFSIYSPPLYEIANEINKRSNNFMANQLFLTIGDENGHTLGAERIINQWLASHKIATDSLSMYDGSGLSIYNQCTVDVFTDVLKTMAKSQWSNEFKNSLAISGVDGTLKNTFRDPLLHNKVYAKTGFIQGARGLSGYIKTNDDEELAFSFMINKRDSRINNFNRIAERILIELVSFCRDQNYAPL